MNSDDGINLYIQRILASLNTESITEHLLCVSHLGHKDEQDMVATIESSQRGKTAQHEIRALQETHYDVTTSLW